MRRHSSSNEEEEASPPNKRSSSEKHNRAMRQSLSSYVRPHLDNISFITWHYIYFCGTSLVASLIFWGSSTPERSVRYIDSFFLVVSAMTEAGLNTVNLSTLNIWQQFMLFFLILIGSPIFVSIAIIHIRKTAMERRLEELAEGKRVRLGLQTLTISLSKRRPENSASDEREEAVASGVVHGATIRDPDPQEEYRPTFISKTRSDDDDEVEENKDTLSNGNIDQEPEPPTPRHIAFGDTPRPARQGAGNPALQLQRRRSFQNAGVSVHRTVSHPRHSQPVVHPDSLGRLDDKRQPQPKSPSELDHYLETMNGLIGRNSQFHHLTEKERRALGGIEYDAIWILSWGVPLYYILWNLFGAIGMGAWLQINRPDLATSNGLNPFWAGSFFAISAFGNSGMALLDANATVLQTSYYSLLTLSLLILAGNTCFPPFLRLIIWTLKNCISKNASPRWLRWRGVLTFILEHPRRVYTNLFPAKQTWWLVAALVILNGIDWVMFEVLNIGNPDVDSIPVRFRVLDGLFQAFAVRCGGFYVVNIAQLYPGLLVLYVLMMYISAFPVTMAIRNTNVYEERSLGIFAEDQSSNNEAEPPAMQSSQSRGRDFLQSFRRTLTMSHGGGSPQLSRSATLRSGADTSWNDRDFLRAQLRGQLGHDLWWIALAVWLICIIETHEINTDPVNFSIFNIIFEVVSAYGCVGISVGIPWNAYSFSGTWQTLSKLILCAVMIRGRHRGLPVAIDRAILLPSRTLGWAEEEDAKRRMGIARRDDLRAMEEGSVAERRREEAGV